VLVICLAVVGLNIMAGGRFVEKINDAETSRVYSVWLISSTVD